MPGPAGPRASRTERRRPRPLSLGVATALLIAAAAVGGVVGIVASTVGFVLWRTEADLTVAAAALATAWTAYLLCRRIVPALDRRARRLTPPPNRTVRGACLLAGTLVAVALAPVAPVSWVQALPSAAFVAISGGGGVAIAAGRARLSARR